MKYEDIGQTPIFQKAEEIFKIANAIVKAIPDDNEYMQETTARFMIESAVTIPAKLSGAMAIDLYDLQMEAAAIIRKNARELYVLVGSLRFDDDFKEKEYIELLRNAIEDFRFLFVDWVATFDPYNYIIDRWGLFNPPGISAHDKDPDYDIPFNPDDFLEDFENDSDDEN